MAHRRILRTQKRTLLIYGEGQDEAAFVKQIKALFFSGKGVLEITVIAGHGGSPESLLTKAARTPQEFDQRAILLDSDRLQVKERRKAKENNIELIVSEPALEGLLLSILGHKIPTTTDLCRRKLEELVGQTESSPDWWNKHFPKPVIAAALARKNDDRLVALHRLVDLVGGNG